MNLSPGSSQLQIFLQLTCFLQSLNGVVVPTKFTMAESSMNHAVASPAKDGRWGLILARDLASFFHPPPVHLGHQVMHGEILIQATKLTKTHHVLIGVQVSSSIPCHSLGCHTPKTDHDSCACRSHQGGRPPSAQLPQAMWHRDRLGAPSTGNSALLRLQEPRSKSPCFKLPLGEELFVEESSSHSSSTKVSTVQICESLCCTCNILILQEDSNSLVIRSTRQLLDHALF